MFFIIRKEAKPSPKTNFVVKLLSQTTLSNNIFYVFKEKNTGFKEKWYCDRVQLPPSIRGLVTYYLLMMMKSPADFRTGLMARLSLIKPNYVLTGHGFLSALSNVLYLRFGSSARAERLMRLLDKLGSPKVFLIDEFISLNCLDLRNLKLLGPIIYVSSDIAYNLFDFGDNVITRRLMFRFERDALVYMNLVVSCSEMERLKYLEMGARNVISYPNIYPTAEFEPNGKDEMPSISIVLKRRWGPKAEQALETIFNALACLKRKINVYVIGLKPSKIPKNITLEHHEFIKSKSDYLKVLGKSWIGINVGIHLAGTNERKYDYAEAGTVVMSDTLGARGELIPHEYNYVDSHDLAAKLEQLFEFGRASLIEMGKENRECVLSIAEKHRLKLLYTLRKIAVDFKRQ